MSDKVSFPALDESIYNELNKTFMHDVRGLGLFQELWSDVGPSDQMGKFLLDQKGQNIVLLQALTSWKRPFTGADRVSSGNPDAACELPATKQV